MKGQMNLQMLLPVAMIFVVLGVALAVGANVTDQVTQNSCDFSWVDNTSIPTGSLGVNPVTGGNWGCCTTLAATGGNNNCSVWTTNDYAINASTRSIEGLDELAGWQPTIALVIAAAIILSILLGSLYIKFGRGGGI